MSAAPVSRSKRKRQLLKAIRRGRNSLSRAEIVEAARTILQEDGIDKLSMRHIAEKLKCSVASPYAHFKSREEIIGELFRIGENNLTMELRAAQESSSDVYEQLSAIAHTYWKFSRENGAMHKLMYMSSGKMYRRVFPSLPTSYRVFLETVRAGFKSGAFGHRSKTYSAIARTMWAWMYGLIVLDMNGMLREKSGDPIAEGISFFHVLLRNADQVEDQISAGKPRLS